MCRCLHDAGADVLTCVIVLLQLVKAGLALGLFGGTHKFLDDKVICMLSCVMQLLMWTIIFV